MFNNNSQENNKAFEQSVDTLANILVDFIDNIKNNEKIEFCSLGENIKLLKDN